MNKALHKLVKAIHINLEVSWQCIFFFLHKCSASSFLVTIEGLIGNKGKELRWESQVEGLLVGFSLRSGLITIHIWTMLNHKFPPGWESRISFNFFLQNTVLSSLLLSPWTFLKSWALTFSIREVCASHWYSVLPLGLKKKKRGGLKCYISKGLY